MTKRIWVAVIAVCAVVTVATAGAGAPAAVAAVHCVAAGALEGAVVGAVTGAAVGAVEGAVEHVVTTGGFEGIGEAMLEKAADGFMMGAITGAVTGAITSPYCFIAGTAVLTSVGMVTIENIRAGDIVWAYNQETGRAELKRVLDTTVNETNELVHLGIGSEEIITTPSHPFYSPIKGWTRAIDLRAGDVLQSVNGEVVIVEWVQHEILESPVKVYNFEVEGDHTYYVSEIGVLVHNGCGENPTTKRGRAIHKEWDYGGLVKKEVSLPGAGRADGVDFINHIVYELKPDNPRAIRQGWRQLTRYVNALEETYRGNWIRILVTYE